jgi:hypothetical protein
MKRASRLRAILASTIVSLMLSVGTASAQTWEYAEFEFNQEPALQVYRVSTPSETRLATGTFPVSAEGLEELGITADDETNMPPTLRILNLLGADGWKVVGYSRQEKDAQHIRFQHLFRRGVDWPLRVGYWP